MGLSASARLVGFYDDLAASLQERSELGSERDGLSAEHSQNELTISEQQSELNRLFSEMDTRQANMDRCDAEIERLQNEEDPNNKLYCGIKEFVVEDAGMCGMGMGMGQLELNECIKLTGKELVAMDKVLKGNSDGQYSVCDLVKQLKDMGIDNAQVSEDGASIELTRVDENGNETKVKFCDANGDGMLNSCDYDFSDALCKFNQDLDAFNAKIQVQEDLKAAEKVEFDKAEAKANELSRQMDATKKQDNQTQEQLDITENNIEQTDEDITLTRSQIDAAEEEQEAQETAESEETDEADETGETDETEDGKKTKRGEPVAA